HMESCAQRTKRSSGFSMASILHLNNPVQVHHRGDALQTLASLLGRGPYIVVTSAGWSKRGMIQRMAAACGEAHAVFDSIPVNPTLEDLASLDPALPPFRGKATAVVALGGGSVMDAAKAM